MLERANSILVVIDMQARLLQAMPDASALVQRCRLLTASAMRLGIPVHVTEQRPDKLGETVGELLDVLNGVPRQVKSAFGILGDPECERALRASGRGQVVLTGIESHVCVLQSALQLLKAGWEVFVAVDAVSSRRLLDHETALHRMAQAGVHLVTVEMAVFEWLRDAADPAFRSLHGLVKNL